MAKMPDTHIKNDEILDFLTLRSALGACPCCQSARWTNFRAPYAHMDFTIPFSYQQPAGAIPDGIPLLSGLDVVTIYCVNCGFVRQHAAHIIRAWVAQQNDK
ncbi:MAG: hypothetical protein ACRYF5_17850 [Janthinobacterium lividum]